MMTMAPSSKLGPREVFRNQYMVLRHDAHRRVLILTRLPLPYASIDDMRETFLQADGSIGYLSRPRTMLLIDSRHAPARNDPHFEAEFARLRKHLLRDFQKIATLVKTAVGMLQVSRQVRGDETPMGVFNDPAEALTFLGVTLDPARIEVRE